MNKTAIENFQTLKLNILKLCKKINRNPSDINIVAVSKQQSNEKIIEFLQTGHNCFGENRIEETKHKWANIKKGDISLHFVGALQSKKVKEILNYCDVIETLDTESSAEKIAKFCDNLKKSPKIFIQINLGKEKQKRGILTNDIEMFLKMCKEKYNLKIAGAMCLPPNDRDPKKYFQEMREICIKYSLNEISMGMSEDYIEAIKLGSTNIRIGTSIFGKRK